MQAKIRAAIIYLATPQECPPGQRQRAAGRLVAPAEAPQAAAAVAHAAARGAAILRFQLFLFFISLFRFLIIFLDIIVTVVYEF